MKIRIIKPSVEEFINDNHIRHVAKCARICYHSEIDNQEADNNLIQRLKNKSHLSMFRHDTIYSIISLDELNNNNNVYCFEKDKFIDYKFVGTNIFIVINGQTYIELSNRQRESYQAFIKLINKNEVTQEEFIKRGGPCVEDMVRFTFKLVTQISTSRELNRVSPNNIAEESTRYCKYNSPKFGETLTLCLPHWLDMLDDEFISADKRKLAYAVFNSCLPDDVIKQYIYSVVNSFKAYCKLSKLGLNAQDARGVLPLDTATTVVYTYSIKEWKHIINLRYYEITGPVQPNAKEVIEEIYKILKQKHLLV